MDFQALVIFIFVGFGLCARAIFGLNLWSLFLTMSLLMLILPFFLMPSLSEPEIARTIADTAVMYITNLRNWLPSMLVGALAGIFARELFSLPKVIIDVVRGLF